MSFKSPSLLRSVVSGACLSLSLLCMPTAAQAQTAPANPTAATEAAAAAVPAAPGMQAVTTKETIDNPYGLQAMWEHGDFVAKGTLFILIFMSMGSWYILVTKMMQSFKLAGQARAARLKFFKAATLPEGLKVLDEASAFRFLAQTGINAQEHHEGTLTEHIDRNTWVTMSVDRAVAEVQSRLQDGLAFLATVGSTAPFVGLFGTVWGIYHALTAIGIAGQASIDKVAGPVGEALIMTAIGLAVAVPAVLGYNWLVRRNKVALDGVRSFAADLHGVLMGAKLAGARPAR
jgi:biopolymer transport protein ExbB